MMIDNDADLSNGFAMHAVLTDPSADFTTIEVLPILGYEISNHYLRLIGTHSIEVFFN